MEEIIIRLRDPEKGQALLALLRTLDFVDVVAPPPAAGAHPVDEEAFFAAAGLWEGRDISGTSLRRQAWSR